MDTYVDHDDWLEKTSAIREWIKGGCVSNDRLVVQLELALDFARKGQGL